MAINAETYSYTFTKTTFTANGTKDLNGVNWTISGEGGHWGYDSNKGQQFGSSNNPYKTLTMSTTDIQGTITEIKINTSGAKSINATMKATVGGQQFGSNVTLTTTATTYTLTGSASGPIAFTYTQTSSKAIYIKSIEITYTPSEGPTMETVATPVISPASGEITADTEVSIECTTEGATIKYTIDDTEPSAENGIIYTKPFTLNEDATVKAIAIKDGYNNSAVATATYTLFVSSEYSYELATSVENGGHYIIVGEKDGNYFAMGEQKTNNRAAVAVTLDGNGTIVKPSVKVYEIELQGSEGEWSFYDPANNGYLYSNDGGANRLKISSELTDETKATITFNENAAIITFINTTPGATETRNILRYNPNNGSPLFSCYASGQQDVYLYQRVGDIPTGIEDTMVDENAPVEYYNLQGVKVANPENGIFIKKQGGRTSKVVL